MLSLGVAAAWAVAPALSTGPYVPRAVEFVQPLAGKVERLEESGGAHHARAAGAGSAHDHNEVGFRTGPIKAPRRFDLVGVAGEVRPLWFRTRRAGERWSEWVETVDGNPVWAGGADYVQVRSERRFSGELHYVNVTGTDTPLRRILTGARSAVATAVGAALGTEQADAARALRYVPRSAWGADRAKGGCPPRAKPSYGSPLRLAAVHHTVNTNDYPPELGPRVVLGICRYHRNANGWNDIGYNALVDRYGTLYEGRAGGLNRTVVGAHAAGWNSRSFGVALIGNHVAERPQRKAIAKLVKFFAWKMTYHGLTKAKGRTRVRSLGGSGNKHPSGTRPRLNRVLTHRHLSATTCAGDATERLMRRVRKRIQNKLDRWDGRAPAIFPTEGEPPQEPPAPEDPSDADGGDGGTPSGGVGSSR